jgi:hypothetical protein
VSNDAATHGGELAALQRLLEERERTIADLRDSIRDSRDRLDAEAEERRRIQERLTGLLTHRRGSPECEPQPPERTDRDERQADEPTDNLHGLYTEARRRPHRRDDQRRRRGGAAYPARAADRAATVVAAVVPVGPLQGVRPRHSPKANAKNKAILAGTVVPWWRRWFR